jgi:hypothetical protein
MKLLGFLTFFTTLSLVIAGTIPSLINTSVLTKRDDFVGVSSHRQSPLK